MAETPDRFAELKSHGYKATIQRAVILEVLESTDRHLTASAIADEIGRRRLPLNKSTVYRTLETLVDIGLVKGSRLGRSVFYELHQGDGGHHHLTCSSCGETTHLGPSNADQAIGSEAVAVGFDVKEIQVLVSGTCRRCSNKAKRRGRGPILS